MASSPTTPVFRPAHWLSDFVPQFPAAMLAAERWMVRKIMPGTDNKQPHSALAKKPAGYKPKSKTEDEKPGAWRWRWNQLCCCCDYQTAVDYWKSHSDVEGLSFIVHPGDDESEQLRIVCIDFDNAFGPDGEPWPWIQMYLNIADSYVEFSRSGKGLHLFVQARCKPFTNLTHHVHPDGGAIEVLCSSQVAVTGNVFGSFSEIMEVQ
jgi:hypothetical protein